jgi:hypothetical protein
MRGWNTIIAIERLDALDELNEEVVGAEKEHCVVAVTTRKRT